ncbi:hypothetical protein M419DRAFT_76559 [Trichoderma reesei RUT C-30]|uniref:Serine protease n=1 Tax=Hypocrea jecorina (strain ATCC 56765 / BCRC 32924 / NRRL 11460 / Rut C-30) TaxID=1344414 RepID=A0A024SDB1_HYPJR|nr:hypothetical protein M419DRAFT_76559 [Trichoderma reesei RUT C-30]
MEYQRIVAPGEGHRNRAQNVQPEISSVLDRCNSLKNTIVRLQFMFGGKAVPHGTGFFVNLPSSTHDVILTAAHNLIDEKKTRATNMMVIYGDNDREPATEFRICPTYEKYLETDPKSDERGIYDYGVILLAKNPLLQSKRQGMGLSLGICYDDTLRVSKEVRVSGYDGKDGDSPIQSSGPLVRAGNQLEYLAPTEPGMSGSAVWIPYGGHPMVVGIHNMAPKQELKLGPKPTPKPGSRGARITDEVFRNLCLWTRVGFFNKRLCVMGTKSRPHNTYLCFSRHCEFAKVFLGSSDSAMAQDNVAFDILPATVPPVWAQKSSPLWAFKFCKPPGWGGKGKCWVEWRPSRQQAVLVDTFKEMNLVRFQEATLKGGKKRLCIVLPDGMDESQNQELRLYDDNREEEDIEDGMTEFAGVLFADQGDKNALGVSSSLDCFILILG